MPVPARHIQNAAAADGFAVLFDDETAKTLQREMPDILGQATPGLIGAQRTAIEMQGLAIGEKRRIGRVIAGLGDAKDQAFRGQGDRDGHAGTP